jgi:hypothetical protein
MSVADGKHPRIACLIVITLLVNCAFIVALTSNAGALTSGASTSTYISGDFTYSLLNNGAEVEITGYHGAGGAVVIPSTINGKPVTSVGDYSFESCTTLTSITIPNSVTSIGDDAFSCSNLASIAIGSGVITIGDGAFSYTDLTSITIPNSVTSIGSYAFSFCYSLTSINFDGNAPSVGKRWADGDSTLTAYYHEGATGFTTPTWNGVSVKPLPSSSDLGYALIDDGASMQITG